MIPARHWGVLVHYILPISIAVFSWYNIPGGWLLLQKSPDQICYEDNEYGLMCRPNCPLNHFSLAGMLHCMPWLSCEEIQSAHLEFGKLIGQGAVKMVYLARWRGYNVVINVLTQSAYREDFQHGLRMLQGYQQTPEVTQLIGWCGDRYLTEYHRLGSADTLHQVLQKEAYSSYNTVPGRLSLCIQYVQILTLLHHGPLGTRVMCDSNDLEKTLSQYLLRADLHLLVNDLDALPLVDHSKGQYIKCGHREIVGDFPAPEQLWPHDHDFIDEQMPPYDEKIDIWKLPDVCDYILGEEIGSDNVRFNLFKLHKQCKYMNPSLRPELGEILKVYQDLLTNINSA